MKNILFATDMYKTGHINQYPKGTTEVYSTFTPRSSKYAPMRGMNSVIVFGIQGFIKKFLRDEFNKFFERSKEEVVKEYKDMMKMTLGIEKF